MPYCIDCNDCELSHSDGKSSELNEEQIKKIMHHGSFAITGLNYPRWLQVYNTEQLR